MLSILRFEELKLWKQRKTYLLICSGVLLLIAFFLFNRYMGNLEQETIDQSVGFSESIFGREKFDQELEEYLLTVNQTIEEQEAAFIDAAGKGESLEEVLTLSTYPFYRTAFNKELIRKKLPIYSMRYGTQSSIFAAIVLTGMASLLGIIYLLLLFGDGLSKEFEEHTMKLYITQPISRGQLYLLKYASAVGHAFLLTIFFAVVAAFVGLLLTGGSSWAYPVIVFTEKSMAFISIAQYILRILCVFFFVLLFCFAVHFLFSTLCRKTSFSLIATVFVLAECHFISVSSNELLRKVAHLNPFTYLNVGKLFVGYDFREYAQYSIENQEYYANRCLPRVLHNPQIDLSHGLIALGVSTVFLLWLGCYCFKKNIYIRL